MNTEAMMVDPNDLVIDMPLDEENVQEIMESAREIGIGQSVFVWLNGLRIIDGFHRVEAARRLSIKEIRCEVIDCTEDRFLDLRIISAKKHKSVEDKRMAAWMLESWRQEFGAKTISTEDVRDAYRKFGMPFEQESISTETLQVLTIIDTFRREYGRSPRIIQVGTETVESYRTKKGKVTYQERPILRERDSTELESWFETKALRWGVSVSDIEKMLLSAVGVNERLSQKILTIGQRRRSIVEMFAIINQVGEKVHVSPFGGAWDFDESWIEKVDAGDAFGVSYDAYVKNKEDEERAHRDEETRQTEIRRLREVQYSQTPQGKAEERQKQIERNRTNCMAQLHMARGCLQERYLDFPEAPAMIAMFAQFVADFAAEHFPDVQVAQPNPVSLENSRLRAENAKLKERIASLERALGSKQAAGEMLSSAMAWSSGDLER